MTKYDFTVKRGDTYQGVEFQLIKNGSAIDLTDATIKADFKLKNSGKTLMTMSTDNDKIAITYPLEGRFIFSPQVISVQAGAYQYDIQIQFNDDSLKTYIEGTMTVEQDITE